MKNFNLKLFVTYLVFISGKSFVTPVTMVELGALVCIFLVLVGEKISKIVYRGYLRNLELKYETLNASRPEKQDPEIAALIKENDLEALKLKKFMTQQEYKKREISRAVESRVEQGGLRF